MAEEPTFEEALAELEGIVSRLEAPGVALEASLQLFEQGMRLSRLLEQRLDEAERKIEILVKGDRGELLREPFPAGTPDDGKPS